MIIYGVNVSMIRLLNDKSSEKFSPGHRGMVKVCPELRTRSVCAKSVNPWQLSLADAHWVKGRGPNCEEYPLEWGGSGRGTRVTPVRTEGHGLRTMGPFRLQENHLDGQMADCGRTGTDSIPRYRNLRDQEYSLTVLTLVCEWGGENSGN